MPPPKRRKTWKTVLNLHTAHPVNYYEPETLNHIVKIVADAESKKLRVRAVGSGHSWSDIAITDDVLIHPKKLKNIDRPKDLKSTVTNPSELVEVEAGTTLKRLNKKLTKMGLAITNSGGVDHQTISGAIATGTHGSGIRLPAISGMVQSILMVSTGGKINRIEPGNGVSDPANYPLLIGNNRVQLLQDDDKFNSALVSLGCLGIVYSYVLRVRPMYWIEEVRFKCDWLTVKALLESSPSPFHAQTVKPLKDQTILDWKDPNRKLGWMVDWFNRLPRGDQQILRGVWVRINPYIVKGNTTNSCIVLLHVFHDREPQYNAIGDRVRNIFSGAADKLPFSPFVARFIANNFPKRIPNNMEGSLNVQKDRRYYNIAPKVLILGLENIKEYGYTSEFAFDVTHHQPTGNLTYIQAVDDLIDEADKLATQGNIYQPGTIGLRFVEKSAAHLTMEVGFDACFIDCPVLSKVKGVDQLLNRYQEVLLALNGRPHWGKINNKLTPRMVQALYGQRLTDWQKNFKFFNDLPPNGTGYGIFRNDFSDRLELHL